MQAQEEKVQSLVAIHVCLLAVAEKGVLLWAAGVPDSDVATITEAATSLPEEPGTSTGEITPQGPQASGTPISPDHS